MSRPLNSVEHAIKLGTGYLEVPFHRFLGARLEALSRDECTISFDTTEQLLTPMGTLHAAAIYTALELANVMAILPNITAEETAMSIQHTVSLIGSVAGLNQRVIVRSRMLKRGSSIAFFESEAYNAKDMSILAKGNTTKAIKKIPKKEDSPRSSKL